MAIEKKQEYSQIELTKKRSSQTTDDELICTFVPPTTCKSSGSTSSTDAVIIDDEDDDDDEEITLLEPKQKKPRFVSWWDNDDAFKELSCVVKGLPKSKDPASKTVDSILSSTNTNLHETKEEEDERSLSSVHHDLCEDESYSHGNNKENQDRVGTGHVSLGVPMQDPLLRRCYFSCFSSNDLLETEANAKKNNKDKLCTLVPPTTFKSSGSTSSTDAVIIIIDEDEKETLLEPKKKKPRFVSSWDNDESYSHGNNNKENQDRVGNSHVSLGESMKDPWPDGCCFPSLSFNDLLETTEAKDNEIIAGESSGSSNINGNRHVALEELGVTVEDLKSMPWEAFDPTWEIRSETMDPWLGGYIKDLTL